MAAPRTLKPVVAILVVVAAILMLLAAGIVHAAEELLDNVGHANVCAPGERGECWVVESAVVERSGLEELVVRSAEGGSGAIRVEAMSEWELPPPAGAPVSLERWGGGDVGYVHDPASGRR